MSRVLNVLSGGLGDALSLWIPLALLLDNFNVLGQTARIYLSNAVLVCGVVVVYFKGIVPMSAYLSTSSAVNELSYHLVHGVWLLPVCLYCHFSAPSRYQVLADHVLTHIYQSRSQTRSFEKYVSEGSYGFVAWLCVFVQVQLFGAILPLILTYICAPFAKVAIVSMFLTDSTRALVFLSDFLSCALYAWYCFDFRWTSEGLDPDTRFATIEKHWPYFIGFGLPFVVINKVFSGFWGYAAFMAYFPLAIIIATTANYEYYANLQVAKIAPLRIFWSTQVAALRIVQVLDKKRKEAIDAPTKTDKKTI